MDSNKYQRREKEDNDERYYSSRISTRDIKEGNGWDATGTSSSY